MRQIIIEDKLYNLLGVIFEDGEIQQIIRNKYETPKEEELTIIYNMFHKKKSVV